MMLLVASYGVLLALLSIYGLNTVLLVVLHRGSRPRPAPSALPDELPVVTVQLPVYNEALVVERLLRAVAELDWPADRLEIQLLDDSTDDTSAIAAPVVAELRARGLDVAHIRRADRVGFKAGALAVGMERARGSLIALFDADFVPPPGFLRAAVPHLQDPGVAAVQGRWTHLNRDWSRLTRAEALAIDGHFGVEQAARARTGLFLNFNGSAGVWRRAAIADAGGWSADTLTEDLDLSYRAQLAGWHIAYDPALVCPSELPVDLEAFKAQQRRWATGSMQTARKLLPRVWAARLPLFTKAQATLHLTHYAVHPLIALTALLTLPAVLAPGVFDTPLRLGAVLLPFVLAMSGPTLLHTYAQRVLEGRLLRPADLGWLTLFGVGIAISNTRAVVDAFVGRGQPFVRTPKSGVTRRDQSLPQRYRMPGDGLRGLEALLAAYCAVSTVALAAAGLYEIAPFTLLDAAAFGAVAATGAVQARACASPS